MAALYLSIHPENPQERRIDQVVELLRKGGVIIYPTDTIYGIGCDIHNAKAIEKVARLKGLKPAKANFSFICNDLSHLSEYAKQISTPVFKVMKKALPGPYTFILNANNHVPKILHSNKKTVGIRVPNNVIPRMLVEKLGNPIITTSIHDDDTVIEYTTDPEDIYEKFEHLVDAVIDGGPGNNVPSTVINATQDDLEIIREGAGSVDILY